MSRLYIRILYTLYDGDDDEDDLILAYVASVYPYIVYFDKNKNCNKHEHESLQ